MGKAGKKRRKLTRQREAADDGASDSDAGTAASASRVATAVGVLTEAAKTPGTILRPELRALRAAVFEFQRALPARGTSSVGAISDALRDGRFGDAVPMLRALAGKKRPPLGSLQRWVRDIDGVAGGAGAEAAWRAMDAVLRASTPELVGAADGPSLKYGERKEGGVVTWAEPWVVPGGVVLPEADYVEADARIEFRVCGGEAAAERRPPNRHPMLIYTEKTADAARALALPAAPPAPVHSPDFVPSVRVVEGALSARECARWVAAAEVAGFTPDVPATGSPSILAHNFVWCASERVNASLFERARHALPAGSMGLNRRWRVYRYSPGAHYRPHIDGAWPPSGLTEGDEGEYIYDTSAGKLRSKLTFLLYLSAGFEGGCTSYFVPSAEAHAPCLRARGILPSTGSIAIFPHGQSEGSLLHEGSPLLSGTKYIIRTEVLMAFGAGDVLDI